MRQYLIIFVRVRSVTGAIAACVVVIVVIFDVFLVFGLRKEQTLSTSKADKLWDGETGTFKKRTTYWTELALKIPELFISTITAKISTGSGEMLRAISRHKACVHGTNMVYFKYLLVYNSKMSCPSWHSFAQARQIPAGSAELGVQVLQANTACLFT